MDDKHHLKLLLRLAGVHRNMTLQESSQKTRCLSNIGRAVLGNARGTREELSRRERKIATAAPFPFALAPRASRARSLTPLAGQENQLKYTCALESCSEWFQFLEALREFCWMLDLTKVSELTTLVYASRFLCVNGKHTGIKTLFLN